MKLVDILARELKVWPDQYYQIYQDSGGNLIGTLSNNDLEDCDSEDLPYDPVTIAWNGSSAIVGRSEWQAAVDALYPKQAVTEEWNGEGLPPVGTECEYLENGNGDWKPVRVVALDEKLRFCDTFIVFHGDNGYSADSRAELFRPIRTPEQIAAEARDKAVNEMLSDLRQPPAISARYVCEELFDLGYRKFEIVEGE